MKKTIFIMVLVCLNMQGMKRKRGVEDTPFRPITRAYRKKCIDLEKAYSKILPVWESIPAISNEYRKITFHPGFMQNLEDTLRNKPDTVMNHGDCVYSVVYSPDGKKLASSGDCRKITLWNVDGIGNDSVREFDHGEQVYSIAYSPDGKKMASSDEFSQIKLWDVDGASNEPVREFDHGEEVYSIAYSPDGRQLASCGDGGIKLWDVEGDSNQAVREFNCGFYVNSITYSPDGKKLASGSGYGTVKLWDVDGVGSDAVCEFDHDDFVRSIVYSPDGKQLASVGGYGTVKLWDVDGASSDPVREFDHGDFAGSIAYSPDGRQLASGGGRGRKIKLWDIADRISFSDRLKGKRDHLSCAQYDLLKAIQEVYLLHRFAQARTNKPIDPIELDSSYTYVFKSFPRCIQKRLERYVQLYKTSGYKSPHETL